MDLSSIAAKIRQFADELDALAGQSTAGVPTPAGLAAAPPAIIEAPTPAGETWTPDELSRQGRLALVAIYNALPGADVGSADRRLPRDLRTQIMELEDTVEIETAESGEESAYEWYEDVDCEVTGEHGLMAWVGDSSGDGHYVSAGVLTLIEEGQATLDALLDGSVTM